MSAENSISPAAECDDIGAGRLRIDRWLWYARVFKSRSLSQKSVKSGRIRLNKQRIESPSQTIKPGDVLTITLERQIKVLKILELGKRRGPASEAQGLYVDLSPVPSKDEEKPTRVGPRPTKRDRRKIDELFEEN